MTVKELKRITASATTLKLILTRNTHDAVNEISIGKPIYTSIHEENNYDDKREVLMLYPSKRDELEVWVRY